MLDGREIRKQCGVVNDAIEPARLRLDRVREAGELGAPCNLEIERQGERLRIAPRDSLVVHRLELLRLPSVQQHRRARARAGGSDGASGALSRAATETDAMGWR